jgi:hypothetical protein
MVENGIRLIKGCEIQLNIHKGGGRRRKGKEDDYEEEEEDEVEEKKGIV